MRMMPEYTHSAEKTRDTSYTTLDDENASQHVTCTVVMVLSNQPIRFSDGAL